MSFHFKYITAFILLICIAYSFAIDHIIRNKTNNFSFYNKCSFVWGHRGHTAIHKENTPESWNHAIALGAKGIEMDVYFDNQQNQFIVSHHKPYEPYNGKPLLLQYALSTIQDDTYIWIDLKDLDNITDISLAVRKLYQLLKTRNKLEHAIIESEEGLLLAKFQSSGMHTSYWTSFSENTMSRFRYIIKDLWRKTVILYGGFSAISMPYYHYQKNAQETYINYPTLLFTVNSEATLRKLKAFSSVKVVLSDEDFFNEKKPGCL